MNRAEGTRTLGRRVRAMRGRTAGAVASLVVVAATAAAIILALHVVFVIFDTNPNNGIVEFVNGFADTLVWQFEGLFVPDSESLRVLINFGLAAVVYLVVGRIVAGLVRRLG